MGLRRWTKKEDALIEEFWGKITDDEFCNLIGRTWNGIRSRAFRLGLELRKPEMINEELLLELRRRIRA